MRKHNKSWTVGAERFHRAGKCLQHLDRMWRGQLSRDLMVEGSEAEMKAQGKTPCRVCGG